MTPTPDTEAAALVVAALFALAIPIIHCIAHRKTKDKRHDPF